MLVACYYTSMYLYAGFSDDILDFHYTVEIARHVRMEQVLRVKILYTFEKNCLNFHSSRKTTKQRLTSFFADPNVKNEYYNIHIENDIFRTMRIRGLLCESS